MGTHAVSVSDPGEEKASDLKMMNNPFYIILCYYFIFILYHIIIIYNLFCPCVQGEDVELKCDYDLQGDKLYSVKWYRYSYIDLQGDKIYSVKWYRYIYVI